MKFPIRIPEGYQLIMTQPYANTTLNDWYKSRGITAPYHNGIDVVIGKNWRTDTAVTYGTACVTPTDGWTVAKKTFTTTISTSGNGMTIQSPVKTIDGVDTICQLVFWHLSGVEDGTIEKEGDTVGYIGNSGTVRPAPSANCVHCGSHLHFMKFLFRKVNGQYVNVASENGVKGALDPLSAFDKNDPFVFELNDPFRGEDTGIEKDTPAIKHYLDKVKEKLDWIVGILSTRKIK
tara:strand:- start:168 stop:869 length:702 start_codon:yes stop_codon:yes gene_type:complete